MTFFGLNCKAQCLDQLPDSSTCHAHVYAGLDATDAAVPLQAMLQMFCVGLNFFKAAAA